MLLTADQIADMIGVSRRQVAERLCYEPDFPEPYVFGRKLRRWRREDVEEWVEARRQSKRSAMSAAVSLK